MTPRHANPIALVLVLPLLASCGEAPRPMVRQTSQSIEAGATIDCQAARERLLKDCERMIGRIEIGKYCETKGSPPALDVESAKPDKDPAVKRAADLETPAPALPAFADFPKDGPRRAKVPLIKLSEHRAYFDRFIGFCEADDPKAALLVICQMEADEHQPCGDK